MSALEVHRLVVEFGHGRHVTRAVDEVDLAVQPGQVVGLVGESGSGKSTVGRAAIGAVRPTSGTIVVGGCETGARSHRDRRARARAVQMVFQDPSSSLNPRMPVVEAIGEALTAHHRMTRAQRRAEVDRLLVQVALDPQVAGLLPRQLSGGQRQRVAIARALAVRPRVIVADEVTSALDVSVQGTVLNVLRAIREETGVALLFISHNLAVVRYLSDVIAVMRGGRIVEQGDGERLVSAPREEYTRTLLASVLAPVGGRPER